MGGNHSSRRDEHVSISWCNIINYLPIDKNELFKNCRKELKEYYSAVKMKLKSNGFDDSSSVILMTSLLMGPDSVGFLAGFCL